MTPILVPIQLLPTKPYVITFTLGNFRKHTNVGDISNQMFHSPAHILKCWICSNYLQFERITNTLDICYIYLINQWKVLLIANSPSAWHYVNQYTSSKETSFIIGTYVLSGAQLSPQPALLNILQTNCPQVKQ